MTLQPNGLWIPDSADGCKPEDRRSTHRVQLTRSPVVRRDEDEEDRAVRAAHREAKRLKRKAHRIARKRAKLARRKK